jgi:hypothetical protein
MSVEITCFALAVDVQVSPMARLALLALGDNYAHSGPHWDVTEAVVRWSRWSPHEL